MQSVFAFHDHQKFKVHLYATSASDGSRSRDRIESGSDQFLDVSTWSDDAVVERIISDGIHILVNLGGYTKGARNEIFAVRPCPVQISLMGFAGTLGAGWCDYIVCDAISCPEDLTAEFFARAKAGSDLKNDFDFGPSVGTEGDPEFPADDWVYSENFIYMPHSFLVTDHKQSSRGDEDLTVQQRAAISNDKIWDDEQRRRTLARQLLFPELAADVVIFANFNQLYKIDPEIYALWLKILSLVPRSVLWLLRFPAAGEEHLLRTARAWAGEEVASRVRFTEIARKDDHIMRCRVADIFLDTIECNAHTTASDVLWSGTPIITWPRHRYKMCSRVAASVAHATGFGAEMVVSSLDEYQELAVSWARGAHQSDSALRNLRRNLFLNRDRMPLFDTQRWTRNIEKGYQAAWVRWVNGSEDRDSKSGCIFVHDDDPVGIIRFD
ncbi:hypothetical protein HWV62_25006 [Athelia sp. TMB]|nr:hypothetical protein HWV62_25006 [Athelia sp. TMB]